MRALFAILALVFSLAMATLARGAEAPIPPPPTQWVTDNVGLMSPAARRSLDARLQQYEKQTGHQVVVWIGDTVGDTPLDDWAVRTFAAWGIGQKGKDDGIAVFVLAKDQKIDIEVGYGLEDRVPDAIASRVIREVMKPRIFAGDADGGIIAGADALVRAIEGGKGLPEAKGKPPPGKTTTDWIVIGVVGAALLVLFLINPSLAVSLLWMIVTAGRGGRSGGNGGGFSGGGGRSGGGGARD